MNLKHALISIILLAVVNFIRADGVEQDNVPAFVKAFHELHKEPAPETVTPRANVKFLSIRQKLDHFDAKENRTWDMRYISNDEFYKPGGPLFVYVGGEGRITSDLIRRGHFYDMAKEHKGYLFHTEHRFYGDSRPVSAMSNENMKYLNAEQALADLAHFISTMKKTHDGMNNSKVILAGCSYGGTLVTWFKKLYADLATGGWASSAPLFAKTNFFEYKETMGESIKLIGGNDCYDRIQRGFAELESMFDNKRGAEAKAMLKLCNTFDENNTMNMATLFYEVSQLFAKEIKSNQDNNIQKVCKQIMEGSSDVVGLANFINDKFSPRFCTEISYLAYLTAYLDSSFPGYEMRQWMYQTCNELGWFQTSTSLQQPFGTKYDLEFFTTLCAHAFGQEFTPEYIEKKTEETNKRFGGLNPGVKNVYMTHGQLDPWRHMGIQSGQSATVIPMLTQCQDLRSISDEDSPELRASKEKIASLVRKWLKE